MEKPKNNYINKPVMFKRNNPEEMKLYEWLQRHLKMGEFTQETKSYWMKKMRKEQSNGKNRRESGTTD